MNDLDKTKKWYFDNYPDHRKDSRGTDKRSWVQFGPVEDETSLGTWKVQVFLREEEILSFEGALDQWGTWITAKMEQRYGTNEIQECKATIAQEWSTKSFIQAFIAGLTEFAKICDLERNQEKQKPRYEEVVSTQSTNGK